MTLSPIAALALVAMVAQPAAPPCADMPRNWFATVFTGQCEILVLFDQDQAQSCPDTVRLVGADVSNPDVAFEFVELNMGESRRLRIIGQMAVNLGRQAMELRVTQISDSAIDAAGDRRTTAVYAFGRCFFDDMVVDCRLASNAHFSALTFRLTAPTVERDYIASTPTGVPDGAFCLPSEN